MLGVFHPTLVADPARTWINQVSLRFWIPSGMHRETWVNDHVRTAVAREHSFKLRVVFPSDLIMIERHWKQSMLRDDTSNVGVSSSTECLQKLGSAPTTPSFGPDWPSHGAVPPPQPSPFTGILAWSDPSESLRAKTSWVIPHTGASMLSYAPRFTFP